MQNKTESSKKSLYGVVILIIIGGVIGAKYLSLFFDGDVLPGVVLGVIIAIGLAYLLLPEKRGDFVQVQQKEPSPSLWGNFLKTYKHPTNLPFFIGTIWFLIFGVLFPSETLGKESSNFVLQPLMFFVGLSGFQLLRLKEGVDRFGQKYYGFWVYFFGVFALLFGWGGLILDIFDL